MTVDGGQGAAGTGAGTAGQTGGTGTPPPAAGTGTPPPPAGVTGGSPTPDWTSGLNDELKGYVQTKGYKQPGDVVESYRSLEKLIGVKEKLIQVPEKADDAKAWGEIYDKLGRPQKADDYKVEVPKGGSEEFAKWSQGTFHELGLSRAQGEKLAAKYNEYMMGMHAKQAEAYNATLDTDVKALQKEWGMAFDQNQTVVDNVADKFGMSDDHLAKLKGAMGAAGALKFLYNIGQKLGEHQFVGGEGKTGNGFGLKTPEQARLQINALREDPEFVRRYAGGGAAEREQMDALHRQAYPEEVTGRV